MRTSTALASAIASEKTRQSWHDELAAITAVLFIDAMTKSTADTADSDTINRDTAERDHAPSESAQSQPEKITYYDQLGGAAGVRQLVDRFYDAMDSTAEAADLRRMHAQDLGPMRNTLHEFLSGWLGGPRTYWERNNAACMMSAHAGLPISQAEADQWMRCMQQALNALTVEASARDYIANAFTKVCNAMVNRPLATASVTMVPTTG